MSDYKKLISECRRRHDDRDRGRPVTHERPTHCVYCGAALMGGETKHEPGCKIQKIIDEFIERL